MVAYQDLSALDRGGEVAIAAEIPFVPKLLAERHHIAIEAARVITDRALTAISPARRPALDAWIRRTFGPLARSLSWLPRAGDDLDASRSRADIVPLVAWSGDPALRRSAVELARRWRTLGPAHRSQILAVAADADGPTFERLLAAAPVENDPELRSDLLLALGQVSSPSRLRAALALVWDPRLPLEHARSLVFAGRTTEQLQVVAAYFREHLQQLLARFPDNGSARNAVFAYVFTRVCDAGARDDIAAFVKQTFGAMIGGERVVAQSLERLDQCIAVRRLLRPQFDAWIQKP
jgi:alanyl aminopeptidase